MTAAPARPRPAGPSPSEIRDRLERRDEAADALRRFFSGAINATELTLAMERATTNEKRPVA